MSGDIEVGADGTVVWKNPGIPIQEPEATLLMHSMFIGHGTLMVGRQDDPDHASEESMVFVHVRGACESGSCNKEHVFEIAMPASSLPSVVHGMQKVLDEMGMDE